MIKITRKNIDELLDSGNLYVAMKNGRWWRMRRNGKTKTWVRDNNRIRIPFKVGLKICGSITESDFIVDLSQFGDLSRLGDCLNPSYYRHADDIPKVTAGKQVVSTTLELASVFKLDKSPV